MITNLFLNVIVISISTSFIIIFLLIFAPLLNRRYAIKWKYLLWIVIAFRLVIPFNMDIPFPQLVIDVPAEITAPINAYNDVMGTNENTAPAMSPLETNPTEADPAEADPTEVNHKNAMKSPSRTESKPLKLTLLDIAAYLWLTGCLLFLSVHIFSYLHYKGRVVKKVWL